MVLSNANFLVQPHLLHIPKERIVASFTRVRLGPISCLLPLARHIPAYLCAINPQRVQLFALGEKCGHRLLVAIQLNKMALFAANVPTYYIVTLTTGRVEHLGLGTPVQNLNRVAQMPLQSDNRLHG